jgi:hypothetical protein
MEAFLYYSCELCNEGLYIKQNILSCVNFGLRILEFFFFEQFKADGDNAFAGLDDHFLNFGEGLFFEWGVKGVGH